MRRAVRLLLVGLAVAALLALAAAGAAGWLLSRELSPARLSERLSALAGRPVRVETTSLHWLPFPHLRAEGVVVEPGLSARAVEVSPSLDALLAGRLVLSEVRFVAPEVLLVRDATGIGLGEAPGGRGAPPPLEGLPDLEVEDAAVTLHDVSEAPAREVALRCPRLELEGVAGDRSVEAVCDVARPAAGRLRLRARTRPELALALELEAVDAAALARALGAPAAASFVGALEGTVELELPGSGPAPFSVLLREGGIAAGGVRLGGTSRLRGTLRREDGALRFAEGVLELDEVRYQEVSATDLRAELARESGALDVRALRLGALAGADWALAMGLPDGEATRLELRVRDAGEVSVSDALGRASAAPDASLLPGLRVRGALLEVVYEPGPGQSVATLQLDRADLTATGEGETARLTLEARVGDSPGGLGARVGEGAGGLRVSAAVGPLRRGVPLATERWTLEVDGAALPAGALLPLVPRSWPVPELGAVDLALRADGDGVGTERWGGQLSLRSELPPTGTLDLTLRRAWGGGAAATWEVTDLDLARVVPLLPERLREEPPAGRLSSRGSLEAGGGEAQGDLSATLEACSVRLGALVLERRCRLDGRLSLAAGALTLDDAELRADAASLGRLHGTRLRLEGRLAPPTLTLRRAELRAYGGQLSGSGSLWLGDDPHFDLDLDARSLDVSRLSEAAASPSAEGGGDESAATHLDGSARVRGELRGDPNWMAPLAGGGRLELRGGAVTGLPLERAIARALVDRLPGSGLVLRQAPAHVTPLEWARIPFAFDRGRLRVEDLDVSTPDYRLRGDGSLSHDLRYVLDGTVVLSAESIRRTLELISAPRRMERVLSLPPLPLELRGDLEDASEASVRVNLAGTPQALLRRLLGLPERAGSAVTDALRRGADTAGDLLRLRPRSDR